MEQNLIARANNSSECVGGENVTRNPRDGARLLREPEGGIGLQAFKLQALNTDVFSESGSDTYEIRKPWWR